jgi:Flp pilus assembly protein CpaB
MVSIVIILFVAYAIFGCLGVIVASLWKPSSAVGRWFDENVFKQIEAPE